MGPAGSLWKPGASTQRARRKPRRPPSKDPACSATPVLLRDPPLNLPSSLVTRVWPCCPLTVAACVPSMPSGSCCRAPGPRTRLSSGRRGPWTSHPCPRTSHHQSHPTTFELWAPARPMGAPRLSRDVPHHLQQGTPNCGELPGSPSIPEASGRSQSPAHFSDLPLRRGSVSSNRRTKPAVPARPPAGASPGHAPLGSDPSGWPELGTRDPSFPKCWVPTVPTDAARQQPCPTPRTPAGGFPAQLPTLSDHSSPQTLQPQAASPAPRSQLGLVSLLPT